MLGWIAGVVGAACLLAWLAAVGRLLARRPDRASRRALIDAFDDVEILLRTLETDEALSEPARRRAKRAGMYLRAPIDLWPFGRTDDLVVAIDGIGAAVQTIGGDAVLARWPGDELGANALRAALGLEPVWD